MSVEFEKQTMEVKSKKNFQGGRRKSFLTEKLVGWKIVQNEKQANAVGLFLSMIFFILAILVVII